MESSASHAALIGALIRALAGDSLTPERYRGMNTSSGSSSRRDRAEDGQGENKDMVSIKLGIGYDQGINKRRIMEMILKQTGIPSRALGKVDCHDSYTLVNAVQADAVKLERAFRDECEVTNYGPANESRTTFSDRPEREKPPFKKRFREFHGDAVRGPRVKRFGKK